MIPAKRKIILFCFLLLISAAIVAITAFMQLSSDMTAFLPRGAARAESLLVEQLKTGAASRVILLALSGRDRDQLLKLNRKIASKLRKSDYFTWVGNGEPAWSRADVDELMKWRYLIGPKRNYQAMLNESWLRQNLQERLDDLASSMAGITRRTLARDPTAELMSLIEYWTPAEQPEKYGGVFFSGDMQRSLMLLVVAGSSADLDTQARAINLIQNEFASYGESEVELQLSGPVVFSLQARSRIKNDISWLTIVASAAAIIFLFLAFRSIPVLLFSILPLATAMLAGTAVTALIFNHVHGVTLAFGATLIGIAVDYPMHFFSHLSGRNTVSGSLQKIWPTLRLGALTTVIGFASLVFSNYDGLIQLGVFSIAGIAAASLSIRWVLPAVLSENFQVGTAMKLVQSGFMRIGPVLHRLRYVFVMLVVLALPVLFSGYLKIWNDDLSALSPITAGQRQLDDRMRQDLRASFPARMLIVSGQKAEDVLQQLEQMTPRLENLVAAGRISTYEIATRYLPSADRQMQKQASLPEPDRLRQTLRNAQKGLPFKPGYFEPMVADVSAAREGHPLTPENLGSGLLSQRLGGLLWHSSHGWAASVPLYGLEDISLLASWEVKNENVEVSVMDIKAQTQKMMQGYRHRALTVLVLGAALVWVLLWLGMRDLKAAARVIAVPLAVTLMTVALVALLQTGGLTLFHLVALLLVIGLGIDYGLFFNRLRSNSNEWVSTFPALWKSWLTTVLVFGSLMLSETTVLQALGLTVTLGVTLCFLFGLAWVRPASPDIAGQSRNLTR